MRSREDILRESATIAEVGLSPDPDLASVPGPIDLVDVFRRPEAAPDIARPEAAPDIARQAVAVGAKALWLQLGVVSEQAARLAEAAGLDVVMDACTMRDHAQLKARGRL